MSTPVVGIDLGTSRSSVATVLGGKAVPIPDEDGRVDHPSVVHFPAGGAPVVGHAATPYLVDDPRHTLFAVKRLLGRQWHDPEVRAAVATRPYGLVQGEGGLPMLQARGQTLTPSQVSGLVLRHLGELAHQRLGTPVVNAVVTVPANFNDAQREATRAAAFHAGLHVVRLVNEPTAAALSMRPPLPDGKFLIYDFGGGTFDVTVLERAGDVFRVLSTHGDMALGGDDVDRALADHVRQDCLARHGVDLRLNAAVWAQLIHTCERSKIALSNTYEEMPLRLNNVGPPGHAPLHLSSVWDRTFLDSVAAPYVERSVLVTLAALRHAGLRPGDLDGLLLVGGSSQLKMVPRRLQETLGRQGVAGVHPTAAVALGAAVLAGMVRQGGHGAHVADAGLLLDVLPLTLGIAGPDGAFVPLMPRNSPIPHGASTTLRTQRDGQRSITVEVLQGEHPRAVDNAQVGLLQVTNLPMGDAGRVAVEVMMDMDGDGTLRVMAVDLQSGRVHAGFIRTLGGLSDRDLERTRLLVAASPSPGRAP